MYTCACGSEDWIVGREHTLWEMFTVTAVEDQDDYQECDAGEFGDTISSTGWLEISCANCEKEAPADHPLWPTKEA